VLFYRLLISVIIVRAFCRQEELIILQVDIDESYELANMYEIEAAPTLMFFANGRRQTFQIEGEKTDRIVGTTEIPELRKILAQVSV